MAHQPPLRRPARTIRRGGLVYALTPQSALASKLEQMRAESWHGHWPRPRRFGEAPSATQARLLQRLEAAPVRIYWSGVLYDGRPEAALRYCPPPLGGGNTATALWDKGLIEHAKVDELQADLRVSTVGRSWLRPGRVAYEALWWKAVADLGPELDAAWAAYRLQPTRTPPPKQCRIADIRARMREIYERSRERPPLDAPPPT